MSMGFIKDGKYVQVAGNPPPSGELVTGASTIRKGAVSVPIIAANSSATVTITFADPMPDADYEVIFNAERVQDIAAINKTKNGFVANIFTNQAVPASAAAWICSYTAFKLYTVEGVEELEADVDTINAKVDTINAKIPSSASASNQLVTQEDVFKSGRVGIKNTSQTTGEDILAIADTYATQSATLIYNFRFFDKQAVNAPEGWTDVDLLCTVYHISDIRYNKIVARNVRGDDIWVNTKVNDSWRGWKKLAYSE